MKINMKMDKKYGIYAFLVGIVIATLAGIGTLTGGTAVLILAILGLIVGFLNIGIKETMPFLTVAIALIVAGSANLVAINELVPTLGSILQAVLGNIVVFAAPATVVVAVKSIYALAGKGEQTK